MKKQWVKPNVEVLDIQSTMASGYEGYHDEAYVGEPSYGPHHKS